MASEVVSVVTTQCSHFVEEFKQCHVVITQTMSCCHCRVATTAVMQRLRCVDRRTTETIGGEMKTRNWQLEQWKLERHCICF